MIKEEWKQFTDGEVIIRVDNDEMRKCFEEKCCKENLNGTIFFDSEQFPIYFEYDNSFISSSYEVSSVKKVVSFASLSVMEKVANGLGMKLDEKFKIYELGRNRVFQLTLRGLYDCSFGVTCPGILSDLLIGKHTIERLPWMPKIWDNYWAEDEEEYINVFAWKGSFFDYAMFYAGNCFKTKEDAEKHYYQVLENLKNKIENIDKR